MTVLACGLLLAAAQTASAQCAPSPTGETAVGLKNASSYYLTFYIDGVRKDGVPPGDRSVDFVVTPGEHALRADATIDGETVSASRTGGVPAGHVCTWTVTDSTDRPTVLSGSFETASATRRAGSPPGVETGGVRKLRRAGVALHPAGVGGEHER
jgi:hypothetical protein